MKKAANEFAGKKMINETELNVDPPDRYASLRRTTGLTLLIAIALCIGAMQYLRNTILPEELKSRMAQAFPGGSRLILDNASQVTLYSLRSDGGMRISPSSKAGEFHGYPILGKIELSEKEIQRTKSLIDKAIADNWANRQFCFYPHHGLRVLSGKKTLDCVICFKCKTMMTYSVGTDGSTPFGHAPEKFFNQLLKNAGVPFDPTYKR